MISMALSGAILRLEYRNVSMTFKQRGAAGGLTALSDVSFGVADAEVVSLIGPSGCGKSTLLHIGSGLAMPTAGAVFTDGVRVDGPNAHIALMLQKDLLLPWRTIRENVMLGVEIQRRDPLATKPRVEDVLRAIGLAEFANHYPHQLSGGMRQRAALARTIAVDPSVLLLDEPFSAVDAQTRMILQRDLARTLNRAGKTALLITHDLLEAVILSDRVLVMSRRPGRIIDEITINMPDRDNPIARRQSSRVGEYVSRLMNRLDIDEGSSASVGARAGK
jgi:NitT/TauT family transport system ATP-binding protein